MLAKWRPALCVSLFLIVFLAATHAATDDPQVPNPALSQLKQIDQLKQIIASQRSALDAIKAVDVTAKRHIARSLSRTEVKLCTDKTEESCEIVGESVGQCHWRCNHAQQLDWTTKCNNWYFDCSGCTECIVDNVDPACYDDVAKAMKSLMTTTSMTEMIASFDITTCSTDAKPQCTSQNCITSCEASDAMDDGCTLPAADCACSTPDCVCTQKYTWASANCVAYKAIVGCKGKASTTGSQCSGVSGCELVIFAEEGAYIAANPSQMTPMCYAPQCSAGLVALTGVSLMCATGF